MSMDKLTERATYKESYREQNAKRAKRMIDKAHKDGRISEETYKQFCGALNRAIRG